MDILIFVITVIGLTASGALAPGPLFFATITHGSKHGAKSGLIFSIAHTVVEFSLIMLFALGLLTIASEPIVRNVIGILGGSVLILFGVIQIRNTIRYNLEELKKPKASYRHLFIIGLVFTGLNPYFILWWLTVGAQLIIIALEFAAFRGVVFMFICHIWMDYVWLTGVAYFSKKGTDVMGLKWYKPLMIIFGGILIYFGITFIIPVIV
ncbi:MAG: LysE family transporter [Thermoplasmatales archaeon]|nr:MAG: LysE family transporter [Thermoplasmatales archaeon]